MLIGVQLEVSGNSGTNQWSVTYTGPGSPTGTTWTGSGWASATSRVLITEKKIYNSGTTLDTEITYEVFAGGVSRITGSVSVAGGGIGPSYPPITGIPFGIIGAATATTTGLPTYADDDVYSYDTTATGTAEGGWRYKEPGSASWINLPMTLAPGSAPSVPGGCTDPGVGSVSGANTGSLTVGSYSRNKGTAVAYDSGTITDCVTTCICPDGSTTVQNNPQTVNWEQYKRTHQQWTRSGGVRGFPDLEKAIIRFNPDFKALWWRSEMPQTKRYGFAECDFDGVITQTIQDVEVHPNQAEILQAVTGLPAAMEDTFSYNSYAPWSQSGIYSETVTYLEVRDALVVCADSDCPPPLPGQPDAVCTQELIGYDLLPDGEAYSATRTYSFPSTVGPSADMVTYQGHSNALARYWNSWCNPHWSFGLVTEDWDVDSSPETWNDYWKKVGSQWLNNTGASIAINTRNHLWSEALENDGNGPFLDSLFGGYRWIGQVRWQTKAVSPRTSFVYGEDQESLFSSPDGTVTVSGTDITLTP